MIPSLRSTVRKHLPQIVAVVELVEPPVRHALEKALESRQHHILLVGRPAGHAAQLAASQPHQSLDAPPPDFHGNVVQDIIA